MSAQLKPVPPRPPVVRLPTYLKPDEICALLRIEKKTLYNLVSRRQIPFRKVNRALRFDPAEIDAWTKECAEQR